MLSEKDFEFKQILFLVTKNKEKMAFRNDNILICDASGKVLHQSTCYRLFAVFVVGHISITSVLLQRAKKFGFSIVLMTGAFRPYQTISAFGDGNVLLRRKQYLYEGTDIAAYIVRNKIENQRAQLMSVRNKSDTITASIKMLDEYLVGLAQADSTKRIMGYEGSASRAYFHAYFDNVVWHGRKPRIKFDMTNALLDIGYTILFSYIDALLSVFGFDTYTGFLHRQFYMRKSLTCDLVEPFRVIIDRQVKKGINLGQFQEKHFKIYDEKWVLEYKHSSEYGAIFLNAINAHKADIFLYIRDFYRAFMKGKPVEDYPKWRFE